MRVSRALRIGCTVVAIGTWLAGHAQPLDESGQQRVVLTHNEAFLLGDAELVAGPRVSRWQLSPDGRYLLLQRLQETLSLPLPESKEPPAGENSLLLWDSRAHRTHVLWRQPAPQATVEQAQWLPGTHFALVVERTPAAPGDPQQQRILLRVDAARAAMRTLKILEAGEMLVCSPRQPLASLFDAENHRVRRVHTNGAISPPTPLPADDPRLFPSGQWSPDGALLYLESFSRLPPAPGGRPTIQQRWYSLDVRTGAVTPLAAKPEAAAAPPPDDPIAALPVRLKASSVIAREQEAKHVLRPLWLESVTASERPRALLAPDGLHESLLPGGTGALYESGGALFAVPLLRVSREAWRQALQAVTLAHARMLGVALNQYKQDYDDQYPPAGESAVDVIYPYVRARSLFNNPATDAPGFVYGFRGGALAGSDRAGETILGYLRGPGGRAVLYADGHVLWQPD